MLESNLKPNSTGVSVSPEVLASDLTRWTLGPYHPALPGPMKVKLLLDGEVVVQASTETGFTHRGIEQIFEQESWTAGISLSDRVDAEAAVFGELVYCQAVERLLGLSVSQRSLSIRTLVSELSRIVSHLGYISRLARVMGAETLFHYVSRDREKFIDLFELLTGARFSLNYLRLGGVAHDVSEGFLERVLEVCGTMRHRFKEYNDLFSYNQAFLGRAKGLGAVTLDGVKWASLSGPNARASGHPFDVRKWAPYAAYGNLDFDPVFGMEGEGDAHGRYMMRIREIVQSMDLIRQCSESMPKGDVLGKKADAPIRVPEGESTSRVEGPRGLVSCFVRSGGADRPARVHFRSASRAALDLLPVVLRGCLMEDVPLLLASFDISVAELDR
jgi:NADH-quinone oxidoreductase subunit D